MVNVDTEYIFAHLKNINTSDKLRREGSSFDFLNNSLIASRKRRADGCHRILLILQAFLFCSSWFFIDRIVIVTARAWAYVSVYHKWYEYNEFFARTSPLLNMTNSHSLFLRKFLADGYVRRDIKTNLWGIPLMLKTRTDSAVQVYAGTEVSSSLYKKNHKKFVVFYTYLLTTTL